MTSIADPLPLLRPPVRADVCGSSRMPCHRCSVEARDFPTNRGGMCQKGWTSAEVLTRDRPADDAARARARRGRAARATRAGDAGTRRSTSCTPVSCGSSSGTATTPSRCSAGEASPTRRRTRWASSPVSCSARRFIDYNGRFCMSSAAAGANRTLGIDRGLTFPLADLGGADAVLVVGSNPAATMPPLVQHLAGARSRGGLLVVDPRRVGDGPAHRRRRRHPPRAGAGHRPRRAPRADPRARRRGPGRRGVRRRAHHRLGCRARLGLPVVARAGRGGVRHPRRRAARDRPAARGRGPGARRPRCLRAHRPGRRAVDPGHRRGLGRHQPRRRARPARPRGLRLRPAHRSGQRPGRPRARPEERPAARVPDDRRPRGPRARRRGVGRRPRRPPRPGRPGRRAARRGSAPPGGPRALLVHGANPAVSAPNVSAVREALGRLDLLVVGDFVPSETARHGRRRAARDPVGRGGGHHDDPRGPGRAPPQGARPAR